MEPEQLGFETGKAIAPIIVVIIGFIIGYYILYKNKKDEQRKNILH